jgi:hypothetical protein
MKSRTPLNEGVQSEPELESEALRLLSRQLREMPYLDPPEDLLPSIMGTIRRKRFPWWYRWLTWARSPKSFTFTPLQVGSLVSLALLVSFVSTVYFLRSDRGYQLPAKLPGSVPITLTLNKPEARSVSVVGTFNAWHEKGYEMTRDAARGTWTLLLRLPDGRYEYAFVLDGQNIIPDPEAEFFADDGFGNQNAVLIVRKHHDEAI